MTSRRIAGQFLWVSAGRVLGALLQTITFVLVARNAGPVEFGLLGAAFGIATVIQTGFDFGLSTLIVRERATEKHNPIVTDALRLADVNALYLSAAAAILLLGAGLFLNPVFFMMLPLAVWVGAERQADTWLGVPLADGDAKVNTVNLVLRRAAALGLYSAMIALSVPAILAFSVSLAMASLASSVAVRRYVAGLIMVRRIEHGRQHIFSVARPYWINSLGTQARNLDSAIVSAVAGPFQAGLYGVASRTTGPMRILSTSLATVILPAAAKASPRGVRRLVALTLGVCLCLGILYSAIIFLTPWLVVTFLGDAYGEAVLPIQLAIGGLVFAAAASLFGSILQGVGKQRFVAKTAVGTTIVCLLGASVGSVQFGAIGAATGLAASFTFQALILAIGILAWFRKSA
ncbi:lipopolysaccharide biosynthesis protein [Arthrobacter sp. 9V]|uniref:lipopolysaccharide biosynthesis protein n=1 Tax=Arthrobacter sp. 9V TaxID=2653132 RepID=UPI002E2C63F8|nr:lipopolysaccharide biosynthesis protein [Arthrobacter sp. 9V]